VVGEPNHEKEKRRGGPILPSWKILRLALRTGESSGGRTRQGQFWRKRLGKGIDIAEEEGEMSLFIKGLGGYCKGDSKV